MSKRIALFMGVLLALLPGAAATGHETGFEPNPHPHSVVIDWTDAMLAAIELNPPAPTATTWRMWVAVSSMYDAWAAYDATALSTQHGDDLRRPKGQRTEANKRAAISYAAHRALSFLFPNQQAIFDGVMEHLGLPPSDSTNPATPAGIGNLAAQAVIDFRLDDGSNAGNGFQQIVSDQYPELYAPVNSGDQSAPNGVFGPDFDANHWVPLEVPNGTLLDEDGNPIYDHDDPTTYTTQVFLTPHWGSVVPFALTTGDQFRPPAPPQYGSSAPYTDALGNVTTNDQAWRDQTAEVLELSGDLTDEHKIIAEFWADGPHTWTPPGHWVQLAQGISLRDGHGIDQDIRMHMALTAGLLDAGISAWEAKRAYDFIRPHSAIRYLYQDQLVEAWGGPNKGTQLIDGGTWQPYQSLTFVTPPFAEFTSGHSTFSRASREVLAAFSGSDEMYDGVTLLGRDYDGDGTEDLFGRHVAEPGSMMFEDGPADTVTLQWATLLEAADEAGLSRRYGGIHFQDGDLRAREAGRQIGQQAFQQAQLFWNPFGEMRQTVSELRRSGDLTTGVSRRLTRDVLAARDNINAGRTVLGCADLARFAAVLERSRGGTVSETAYQRLHHQVTTVAGLLCR